MTGVQLATMSTALWIVATVTLFILLAHWSTGESWGLTASLVRGVRSWAEHDRPATTVSSPFIEALPPLLVPRRPIGGVAAVRLPASHGPTALLPPASPRPAVARPANPDLEGTAEIEDLGERRLRR